MARGATSILKIRRISALLAGLSLFLGFAGVVGAEDRASLNEPFEITADRIDYDGVRQLYIATGHVRVEQTARSLVADWVAFSTETRIGVAEGGVELIDGVDCAASHASVALAQAKASAEARFKLAAKIAPRKYGRQLDAKSGDAGDRGVAIVYLDEQDRLA